MMGIMDQEEQASDLRTTLTSDQHAADMLLTVDPGFVHHRKIETVIGRPGMQAVDGAIKALPDLPEWMQAMRIAHIYTHMLLAFCRALPAPTLGELLAARKGTLFCSTEELQATDLAGVERAVTQVSTPGVDEPVVELHYSPRHIIADTLWAQLDQGGMISVVADLQSYQDGKLVFHPLLMGGPWLSSATETDPVSGAEWYGHAFFEHFVEDIDEFVAVEAVPVPTDFQVMQQISESAFKQCLAEILGDSTKADWGGEMSDHFSSHVHLKGKRTTAAFLLKGPARFAPMGLNHLGKNNDQIYRLVQEPADLLIVQHCHEIQPAVRATLRAFAVQPGSPRRYCLIDGRDSLRLLIAYGKVDRALELSGS
jgi:hypothetical protein